MEKNEYLCNVNKTEEQQFAVLTSRVSSAEREKHEAQKKVRLLEQEYSALMSEKEDVQRRLKEKMDEVADTVRQMAQFMMGKGPVTLSDSLRDAVVAGVKEEFEAKLREFVMSKVPSGSLSNVEMIVESLRPQLEVTTKDIEPFR